MQREAVYDAWVPARGAWSPWARPVLFGHMSGSARLVFGPYTPIYWARWAWDVFGEVPAQEAEQSWRNIPVDWAPPAVERVALIVDLRAEVGVHFGLALAGKGYRPVPLYNGCPGPNELIDQGPIIRALRAGADYLAALPLADHAPPAFLLDWRRNSLPCPLQPGMFDNRWKVYPDDLPSARWLHERGISQVLLIQRERVKLQSDLSPILRYWHDAGIRLESKYLSVPGPPGPLHVPPVPAIGRWLYTVLSAVGLQRGPREGFYHIVPKPSHG
jgi:hypothetical protein